MRPLHAFWLMTAALVLLAVESFVLLLSGIGQLVELALAATALYGGLSKAMRTGHRVLLLIAGLGLGLPPILTWLQMVAGKSVVSDEAWTYLLILRWCMVGLGLLVFGFEATPKLSHRLIIGVVGFVWGIFNTGGLSTLLDKGEIAFLLAAITIGTISYWLSSYLKRTEDADGPKA